MKYFILEHFVLYILKSLVAYVMLHPFNLIEANLILELERLSFLVSKMVPKVTSYMTLIITTFFVPHILFLTRHIFFLKHLPIPSLLLLTKISINPLHLQTITFNLWSLSPNTYIILNLANLILPHKSLHTLIKQLFHLILICILLSCLLCHPQTLLLFTYLLHPYLSKSLLEQSNNLAICKTFIVTLFCLLIMLHIIIMHILYHFHFLSVLQTLLSGILLFYFH